MNVPREAYVSRGNWVFLLVAEQFPLIRRKLLASLCYCLLCSQRVAFSEISPKTDSKVVLLAEYQSYQDK